MIVLVVSKVTPSLRGALTRWLLEVQTGVFVGTVSKQVRDRLWTMVLGRKRLGACALIARANNEQGFTIATSGESRHAVVDFDGLTLIRVVPKLSGRSSGRPSAAGNPPVEACGGDPPVRGPVEAGTRDREISHPECTVLPRAE